MTSVKAVKAQSLEYRGRIPLEGADTDMLNSNCAKDIAAIWQDGPAVESANKLVP